MASTEKKIMTLREKHVRRLQELERLCNEVAGLDDAGLPVFHKSAIANARKLRRRRPGDTDA